MKRLLLILLAGMVSSSHAEDVLFLRTGEKRAGRLSGLDAQSFRLGVPLPPQPGAPLNAPPAVASVTISRNDVSHIEFSPDPVQNEKLKSATVAQIPEIGGIWLKQVPWLDVPRSPAARIGCVYGDLLLKSETAKNAGEALTIFRDIEARAWSEEDRMVARQGRLRAMVATGQAKDAVKEALELAEITENPVVLIEAKYILAEADGAALRKLVKDNPRWQEDLLVIPEHARLYHHSLDLYLFPYLFYGSETQPAARGLWGAAEIYDFVGEKASALECARDLLAIYPDTKYAALAAKYIESLPEKLVSHDPEKSARQDLAEAAAPEVSDKKSRDKTSGKTKPENESHEKKPTRKTE